MSVSTLDDAMMMMMMMMVVMTMMMMIQLYTRSSGDTLNIVNLTTNLAVYVWHCAQFTNFCPHVLISTPIVPKIWFA